MGNVQSETLLVRVLITISLAGKLSEIPPRATYELKDALAQPGNTDGKFSSLTSGTEQASLVRLLLVRLLLVRLPQFLSKKEGYHASFECK